LKSGYFAGVGRRTFNVHGTLGLLVIGIGEMTYRRNSAPLSTAP